MHWYVCGKMMKHLAIILLCAACASAHKHDEPSPELRHILKMERDSAIDRLSFYQEKGWIVSRDAEGQPRHQGDSLLWTGIAVGVLPCDQAEPYVGALRKMLKDYSGSLVRFDPLPNEYKNGREVSFDGATGLYFGILSHLLRCNDVGLWEPLWEMHILAVESNNGRLHPNVPLAEADMPPEFTVLPDYISHLLGMRGKPHGDRIWTLEKQLAGWAIGVKAKKAPCFRIHLAWLYAKSLERLNELSESGRDAFCAATDGTDIPLIDHWCGRRHISEWDFKENEWEYRHQRCGEWETPDGKGLRTPALDLIVAYDEVLAGE